MGLIIGALMIIIAIVFPRIGAKQGYLDEVERDPVRTKPRYWDNTLEFRKAYGNYDLKEALCRMYIREIEELIYNPIRVGDMIIIDRKDCYDYFPSNTPMRITYVPEHEPGKPSIYGNNDNCEDQLKRFVMYNEFDMDESKFNAHVGFINPYERIQDKKCQSWATIFGSQAAKGKKYYYINPEEIKIIKYDTGETLDWIGLAFDVKRRVDKKIERARKQGIEINKNLYGMPEFDFSPYHEWSMEKIRERKENF